MSTDYFQAKAAELCDRLSPRQSEVLILASKGMTDREVGRVLRIEHHTVNEHKRQVFKKMGVNTTVEAAVLAAKAGLV